VFIRDAPQDVSQFVSSCWEWFQVHPLQRRQVRVQAAIDFWPFFYYSVAHSPEIWGRIVFSEDEMGRNWLNLLLICSLAIIVPSCGSGQQLLSIAIQPPVETFGSSTTPVNEDMGLKVQLRALGSYIHPPATKDITNTVTWASNTADIATVNSAGVLNAAGVACGDALISATVTTNRSSGNISSQGALVTGYMTASVVCFSGLTLTVDFAGNGSGTVTSSPPGLSCAGTCGASFASGTTIILTAVPNSGSSSAIWSACDFVSGVSGQICTVSNLSSNRTVTVTFN